MKIQLIKEFVLTVTPDELNLIARALRGSLRDVDLEDAADLDRYIGEMKVSIIEHEHKEAMKLKNNLQGTNLRVNE